MAPGPVRIALRSLRAHCGTSVFAAAGIAVAAAVIAGAMVIGVSVRRALRDAATLRLGRITHVITAPIPFTEGLVDRVSKRMTPGSSLSRGAEALILRGAAANADTDAAVPNVQVIGVDDAAPELLPGLLAPTGDSAYIGRPLAADLGLKIGDSLLLTVGKPGAAQNTQWYALRKRTAVTASVRLTVAGILPDPGVGGFSLGGGVTAPRTLYMNRAQLAERTGCLGRANTLLLEVDGAEQAAMGSLNIAISGSMLPEDAGLSFAVEPRTPAAIMRSSQVTLDERTVVGASRPPMGQRWTAGAVSVYLATRIARVSPSGPSIPYSVIASIEHPAGLRAVTGVTAPGPNGIVLNAWLAGQTGAGVDDLVRVEYLAARPGGGFDQQALELRVAGIVAMEGDGANRDLPPAFPGLTDAERMGDWDPPFPVDLKAIRPVDEDYWKSYRAAPKAFVAPEVMQRLWSAGEGRRTSRWVTAVRLIPTAGQSVHRAMEIWRGAVADRLSGLDAGVTVRPIRLQALAGSEGSSDLAMLFLCMGFFLAAAGGAVAANVLTVSMESRAKQIGIMLAVGLARRFVLTALLTEGAVVAGVGAMVGTPLALVYAGAALRSLDPQWRQAGYPLSLQARPEAVAAGIAAAFAIGLVAAFVAALRSTALPPLNLLTTSPSRRQPRVARPSRAAAIAPAATAALAAAVLAAAALFAGLRGALPPTVAFMMLGTLLLLALLLAARLALARAVGGLASSRMPSVPHLALRSIGANPRGPLMTMGLVAVSTFAIIVVAASGRTTPVSETRDRQSGAGGFALIVRASAPLPASLATAVGRSDLGFTPEDEQELRGVMIAPFLVSPGDDVSCTNPARPQSPTILGAPIDVRQWNRFRVRTDQGISGSWAALEDRHGRFAAFGDSESVQWILHSGLNQSLGYAGTSLPREMTCRGLVTESIFAGQLIVSGEDFRGAFPMVTAPGYFLVETPVGRETAVAATIRRVVGDLGYEVRTTAETLSALTAVRNGYLSTFGLFAGLALLFGACGAAAGVLRSAAERRGEFALLQAVGHSASRIRRLLLMESVGIMAVGVAIGAVAALIAILPQLTAAGAQPDWRSAALFVPLTPIAAFAACALASRAASHAPILPALRGD